MFTYCSSPDNTNQPAAPETAETPHEHDALQEGLQLNNGQKWKVNEEMKPYIEKGNALLDEYLNGSNQTDYNKLALDLEEINNNLIESCTMTGPSHDALHLWLHPHLELVETLKNASKPEEANKIIGKIAASYHTYKEFFE